MEYYTAKKKSSHYYYYMQGRKESHRHNVKKKKLDPKEYVFVVLFLESPKIGNRSQNTGVLMTEKPRKASGMLVRFSTLISMAATKLCPLAKHLLSCIGKIFFFAL